MNWRSRLEFLESDNWAKFAEYHDLFFSRSKMDGQRDVFEDSLVFLSSSVTS